MTTHNMRVEYVGNKPEMAHKGDAGSDLRSTEEITLQPGENKLIPTGVYIGTPEGVVSMVCPRSGLAAKHRVTVLNAPGIVDSGYRGEVKVNLINHGTEPYTVSEGERVAQLVLVPFVSPVWESVDELDETERGAKGHGSSGTV